MAYDLQVGPGTQQQEYRERTSNRHRMTPHVLAFEFNSPYGSGQQSARWHISETACLHGSARRAWCKLGAMCLGSSHQIPAVLLRGTIRLDPAGGIAAHCPRPVDSRSTCQKHAHKCGTKQCKAQDLAVELEPNRCSMRLHPRLPMIGHSGHLLCLPAAFVLKRVPMMPASKPVGLMGRVGGRQVAGGDVRAFLAAATEGKDLGDMQVCADEVAAAAEGVNMDDPTSASAFEKTLDVRPLRSHSMRHAGRKLPEMILQPSDAEALLMGQSAFPSVTVLIDWGTGNGGEE